MIRGALETISGNATWLMAGSLVAGFALPQLSGFFRPFIIHSIVLILTVAMMQLDVERLRSYARRPTLLAAIVAVNLVLSPIAMWLLLAPLEVPDGLHQGLVLMAAAPMISSAIALAIILELDAALAVAVMVASYAFVPLTLPALSLWLIGLELGVGFMELFVRLFALITVPALAATVIRRWVLGRKRFLDWSRAINGFGVLFVITFCLGIMSGLQEFVLERPGYAALTLVSAFAANIVFQLLGVLLFLGIGKKQALTIGLVTGNTNLGLVMATMADEASPELIVYFVLGQVPIYFLPVVMLPVYRRIMARDE